MSISLHNKTLPEMLNPFPIMADRLQKFERPPPVFLHQNPKPWSAPDMKVKLPPCSDPKPGTKPMYGMLFAVRF